MLYTDEAIKKRQKRRKKLKSIGTTIVYIVLVPLLIYNISLIVQSVMCPNKTPSFWGIKTYVIISGSMEPSLNIGDIVVAKETKNELNKGDIICFRQGQSIITHRIIEIISENETTEYKTKGDNNNAEDSGTITDRLIEGKVIAKLPLIGNISLLLQNRIIIVSIIVVFYIYFTISHIKNRRRDTRRLKRIRYENNRNKELR